MICKYILEKKAKEKRSEYIFIRQSIIYRFALDVTWHLSIDIGLRFLVELSLIAGSKEIQLCRKIWIKLSKLNSNSIMINLILIHSMSIQDYFLKQTQFQSARYPVLSLNKPSQEKSEKIMRILACELHFNLL